MITSSDEQKRTREIRFADFESSTKFSDQKSPVFMRVSIEYSTYTIQYVHGGKTGHETGIRTKADFH